MAQDIQCRSSHLSDDDSEEENDVVSISDNDDNSGEDNEADVNGRNDASADDDQSPFRLNEIPSHEFNSEGIFQDSRNESAEPGFKLNNAAQLYLDFRPRPTSKILGENFEWRPGHMNFCRALGELKSRIDFSEKHLKRPEMDLGWSAIDRRYGRRNSGLEREININLLQNLNLRSAPTFVFSRDGQSGGFLEISDGNLTITSASGLVTTIRRDRTSDRDNLRQLMRNILIANSRENDELRRRPRPADGRMVERIARHSSVRSYFENLTNLNGTVISSNQPPSQIRAMDRHLNGDRRMDFVEQQQRQQDNRRIAERLLRHESLARESENEPNIPNERTFRFVPV